MSRLIAFPSDAPGGLSAALSAHFGQCDLFTLVRVDADGGIEPVATVQNPDHQQAGCRGPVSLLAAQGVGVLIAAGMGQRPLLAFDQAGIAVHHAAGAATVEAALAAFLAGQLPRFEPGQACGGH